MTKAAQSEFFKNGTCRWCGDTGPDIYRYRHLCEDCDRDVCHCVICETDQHADNRCRHVFQDDNYEWTGAGVGAPSDAVKPALFALLDRMSPEFTFDLKHTIAAGKFYTWHVSPMIGGGGLLELHGMPDRGGRSMFLEWGDRLIEIGSGPDAEKTSDGYRWLASLYKADTRKANQQTIVMLDEWLRRYSREHYDPTHPNRSKEADPLTWCQWLAMDHGAVRIEDDYGMLILRECHIPGPSDDWSDVKAVTK